MHPEFFKKTHTVVSLRYSGKIFPLFAKVMLISQGFPPIRYKYSCCPRSAVNCLHVTNFRIKFAYNR